MPQPKQLSWTQLRVGLLVLTSLIIFAILVFLMTGEGLFERKYLISVFMKDAAGLKTGDPVRLTGVDAGNVAQIRISGSQDPKRAVEVVMRILRKYQQEIRADSAAGLDAEGLLGQRFINLSRGSPGQPLIQPGGEITLKETPELSEVLATGADAMTKLNRIAGRVDRVMEQVESGEGSLGKILYDEALWRKANQTVNDARSLVAHAAAGKGTLGNLLLAEDLYTDIRASVTKVDGILEEVRQGKGSFGRFVYDPKLYENADQLMTRANRVVADVNAGRGTIGRLLKDESFYNRANSATERIDKIAARLERGEGTFGRLLHDPVLYENVNSFTLEMRGLIADFRKNPKQYLTIKFKLF